MPEKRGVASSPSEKDEIYELLISGGTPDTSSGSPAEGASPTPGESGAKMNLNRLAAQEADRYKSRGKQNLGQIRTRKSPRNLPQVSGDEEFLFGPTDRLEEPVTAGLNRLNLGKTPIPKELLRDLPALVRAAMSPDAPPQLIMLVNLISEFTEG